MLKEGYLILSFNKLVILIFGVVMLAACGFQPLYNNNSLSGFVVNAPSDQNERINETPESTNLSIAVSD